jgi:hypothetical protein
MLHITRLLLAVRLQVIRARMDVLTLLNLRLLHFRVITKLVPCKLRLTWSVIAYYVCDYKICAQI